MPDANNTSLNLNQYYNQDTGEIDWNALNTRIGELSQKTSQVAVPEMPEMPGGLNDIAKARWQAAGAGIESQIPVVQGRAEKAAEALKIKGATTQASMQRLAQLQQQTTERTQNYADAWNEAVKKAGEYVENARERTTSLLGKIQELGNDIINDLDFEKAHAFQASVQGLKGSMEEERRAIARKYGTDSKELAQFDQKRKSTIGGIFSQVTSAFGAAVREAGTSVMNAFADAGQRMHMYTNFAEQTHVETLKAKAQLNAAYDLQTSQFQLGVEQLRMSGMDDLANWLVETPEFSIDMAPLLNLMADLQELQARGGGGGGAPGSSTAGALDKATANAIKYFTSGGASTLSQPLGLWTGREKNMYNLYQQAMAGIPALASNSGSRITSAYGSNRLGIRRS